VANSPVVVIGLTFCDRGDNRSKMTSYAPFSTPVADVWNFAFSLGSLAQSMSNAALEKVELRWRHTVDSPAVAPIETDLSRKILLLVTNEDDEINAMTIPSPRVELWETIGPYAGIRLDLGSAGALGLVDMLEAMSLRTKDDRQFGINLIAGGLAL
jgi:hypothetical protein